MSAINTYASLTEFKQWKQIDGYDPGLDTVVERILESVSRYIDDRTMRTFNPRIESRYYSVPYKRELRLDDDLLEVITITNGDGASLPSTEYHLLPKNLSPKFGLLIKSGSQYAWELDSDNGDEYVININGIWGFHSRYTLRGWKLIGTLGAAISDTTTASFTLNTGHSASVGKVYKIDNELFNTTAFSGNVFTVDKRGDNGSTAATHSNSTSVYEWQVMSDIKTLCVEVAHNVFAKRFGESNQGAATITAAGVVITPKDFGKMSDDILRHYKRLT
jgi:hypothetical protein